MAQKPLSKNTDIPDEQGEVRNSDKIDIKNNAAEMSVNPGLQDDFSGNIPIIQIATKQDIKSLEKDIKSLEKDIKSLEKDIQAQKENTDIKFSAVNSKIDSLRSEINAKFESLDIKFDGHKKDFQNTMYKLFALAIGSFAAYTSISMYFFG